MVGARRRGSVAIDDLTDAETDYATLYNMFLGSGAGAAITTGDSNLALGLDALAATTTGTDNTALARGASIQHHRLFQHGRG